TTARAAAPREREFPNNRGDSRAVQHYATAPSLTPSNVTITTPAAAGSAPGDLFLAPYQGTGTPGPMIVDQAGSLVWFHPIPAHEIAANFGLPQFRAAPGRAWWPAR